jgi:hypothetical protein
VVANLILTVTRACPLCCSYCPTSRPGGSSLSTGDALKALRVFSDVYGGGNVKLFGGEPLSRPETVRAILAEALAMPLVRFVTVSTNGLALDDGWIDLLEANPKAVLAVSLDGRPEDHDASRRPSPELPDSYAHVSRLLPRLFRLRRLVVTQTVAPTLAAGVHENFCHLAALGFVRFNILPAYYVPWTDDQLEGLAAGLDRVAGEIRSRWARGEYLHLRNLFARSSTPLFNEGLAVDCDGTIHASNAGLAAGLAGILDHTRVGDLDRPPPVRLLRSRARSTRALLEGLLPADVWRSTVSADRVLTAFCRSILRDYLAQRLGRVGSAA